MHTKKSKLIMFTLLVAVFLSSCTLRVCAPTYVSADTGQQQYACVDRRVGPAQPVFTYFNAARQMNRR